MTYSREGLQEGNQVDGTAIHHKQEGITPPNTVIAKLGSGLNTLNYKMNAGSSATAIQPFTNVVTEAQSAVNEPIQDVKIRFFHITSTYGTVKPN